MPVSSQASEDMRRPPYGKSEGCKASKGAAALWFSEVNIQVKIILSSA
jgi:hypothetical protein